MATFELNLPGTNTDSEF